MFLVVGLELAIVYGWLVVMPTHLYACVYYLRYHCYAACPANDCEMNVNSMAT